MSLHVWWLFVATVFVISAIPGPNMLLVMTHGARFGLRRSFATMAGCLTALVLMLSVSAAGLGVFLQAWPRLFDALRLIGAAYLVWLGVKSWRAKASAVAVDESSHDARAQSAKPAALYRNGFLIAGSNPKSILFAAALLPQFIDAARPVLPQFAVLVATLAVIEVSWYAVYAGLGARIGEKLKSAAVAQAFNRLTGGVFVGFGAMMALLKH
ncbi:LysE family translocator [Caballeronia sp. LZ062]|uniref:LysE family translocator n=1 Tax=unclassified Caballeronia TaxID=2646786 RepID=UPI002855D0D6|nr:MULTISPECIES: LysE family translocator [unclassified Caballeronia]MDR5855684.1 LysE family translocator [Caballeronia sp. LZ050]MDR5872528.1 LysE family translocator [Caballeronia sp. LZ062]